MNTKELIDRIFKEPGIKFELTEFEDLHLPGGLLGSPMICSSVNRLLRMSVLAVDEGLYQLHRGYGAWGAGQSPIAS